MFSLPTHCFPGDFLKEANMHNEKGMLKKKKSKIKRLAKGGLSQNNITGSKTTDNKQG